MEEKNSNVEKKNSAVNQEVTDSSRRKFLRNTGMVTGGVVGGAILGGLLGYPTSETSTPTKSVAHDAHDEPVNYTKALQYFTRSEDFNTLEAATELIFPADDNGPGAKELLVAYYIDHQMAGNWGNNTKEYMTGPFQLSDAVPEQGYQTHLKRNEVFDIGIQALNSYSQEKHKVRFSEIENEEDQIAILQDFENDKVKLNAAVSSSFFFDLLRKATLEGAYSDPMYGGNNMMEGWKMKDFPGHQMNMKEAIQSEEFVELTPQSLQSQHK